MWQGYITNCGTEGNLHGILVGRENLPDGILYASHETHYSVFKAARMYRMDSVKASLPLKVFPFFFHECTPFASCAIQFYVFLTGSCDCVLVCSTVQAPCQVHVETCISVLRLMPAEMNLN